MNTKQMLVIFEQLAPIEKEGKYEAQGRPTRGQAWLLWSEDSESKYRKSFDSIFRPFEIFEYDISSPHPIPSFLKRSELARRRRAIRWEGSFKATESTELRLEYEKLWRIITKDGRQEINDSALPILTARRDALEKTIWRNGKKLEKPFGMILSILKVWLVETEKIIQQKDESDELSQLSFGAARLWDDIIGGRDTEELETPWLASLFF